MILTAKRKTASPFKTREGWIRITANRGVKTPSMWAPG